MRIIGGKYRGRVLKEFSGREIRPTSDRARESLFNILQRKIPGCRFLDLFAGTGGVGIEALSRGAETVWFSDVRRESIAVLKANLALVKEPDKNVLCCDFRDTLGKMRDKGQKFDVIFIDPPYASDFGEEALSLIKQYALLSENGVAVFEHDGVKKCDALRLTDSRKYGVAVFDFYEDEKNEA